MINRLLCCILVRHMNTIVLQLEVTRFLHRCESSSSTSRAITNPTSTGNGAPPTLFGGSSMKVDVACRVSCSLFFFFFFSSSNYGYSFCFGEVILIFCFLENALVCFTGLLLMYL